MTREEAIYLIKSMKYKAMPQEAEAIDMAIEALEQTTWIPCSERLPDIRDDVLFSDDVLVYDLTDFFVAWRTKDGWGSYDSNFDRDTPIVMWMPLLQPYKEGES